MLYRVSDIKSAFINFENKMLRKTIQFLFIFIGFMLLGSQQLHKQFYLISILGIVMMLFGLFGIKEKLADKD
jgi:membrane-bound ClpP family serine protease